MLDFIELHGFSNDWHDLKLPDTDLADLQLAIMSNPRAGKVVKGTGGLRKLRFAPSGWRSGKSGAIRVCYVYFEALSVVLLVVVYPKSEKDDLWASERKQMRDLIVRIEKGLEQARKA